MTERMLQETEKILREIEQRNNLPEVHARYANRLAIAADCGNNEEEYELLFNVVAFLKAKIISDFMHEHGWYINMDDDWHRWEKER